MRPSELPGRAELASPGDIVVCLGAGTITQWAYALARSACRTRPQSGLLHAGHGRRADALLPLCQRCAAGSRPNVPLADLTWFRTGGPAEDTVHAGRCGRPGGFLLACPPTSPSIRSVWARIFWCAMAASRAWSSGSAAGFGQLEAQEQFPHPGGGRGTRRESRTFRARSRYRRINVSERYPRHDWRRLRMNGGAYGGETKDVLVEARAVDRRGRSTCCQTRDMQYTLPPLRRAGGSHLHRGRCCRARRAIAAEIAARHGGDHRTPGIDPAGQDPHRRLDLQESARPQGLAAHRPGGTARVSPSGRRRSRSSIAISSSTRAAPRRRRSRNWVKPSAGASRRPPASSSNGKSSASAYRARVLHEMRDPQEYACCRADGRLVGRAGSEPASGEACGRALEAAGFQVTPLDVQPQHRRSPRRTRSPTSPSTRCMANGARTAAMQGDPRNLGDSLYPFGRAALRRSPCTRKNRNACSAAAGVPVAESMLVDIEEAAAAPSHASCPM